VDATYQAGCCASGYSAAKGCGKAELCPALSLPDLFQARADADGRRRSTALLNAVPPYFSQAVITPTGKRPNLAFGVRLSRSTAQQAWSSRMRARLDPPAGVTARVAGLPALAARRQRGPRLACARIGTLLAGLLAVGARARRATGGWARAVVAARADRARHGLVGAGAVRAADPLNRCRRR
jgi:hypothetical protein